MLLLIKYNCSKEKNQVSIKILSINLAIVVAQTQYLSGFFLAIIENILPNLNKYCIINA